ncbi:MAG: hypothetical protein MR902_06705 [Campylobacter sp.]|nr:hypothetical protein [Campylobacter sp.]
MIAKLIMLGLIVGVIYFFIMPKFSKKKASDKTTQNFVECSVCGTFVDIKEMTIRDGKYICKECENANHRS